MLSLKLKIIGVAALLGAVVASILGGYVAFSEPREYTASIVYAVEERSNSVVFLSHSGTVVAEQTVRQLNSAETVMSDSVETKWQSAQNPGEISLSLRGSSRDTVATLRETLILADPESFFPLGDDPASMRFLSSSDPQRTPETSSLLVTIACGVLGGVTGAVLMWFRQVGRRPASLRDKATR